MAKNEFMEFSKTLSKTNAMLNQLEEELGWQDQPGQTYAAMREVLHALRDRMMPQEAVHFAAQLPMLMAGVFIDGWKMAGKPEKMTAEQLFERIRDKYQYKVEKGIPEIVQAVWRVLKKNVSPGTIENVKANLPKDLVKAIEGGRPLPAM